MTLFDKIVAAEKAKEDVIEKALFFCGEGESTILLHAAGCYIEMDLADGLDRTGEAGPWSEIPKEDGLWIWEGTPSYHRSITYEGIDEGGDVVYEGRGKARRLTEEELKVVNSGMLGRLFGPSQLPGREP